MDDTPASRVDTADDWKALDELLFEGAWDPRLRRLRSPNAFRGLSRTGHDLRTGLLRLGPDPASRERHLIRNFRKYARRSFVGDDSVWNWLALAQHHGLPTRLLDWTYSPYVALHFATSSPDSMEADADVWVVNLREVGRHMPDRLQGLLREEGSQVFTGELLYSAVRSLADLQGLAPEPFPLFLEPPALNDRIVNQAALFSLMSTPDARMDEWLAGRPETWRRVVVPAPLKWEVRDRLDQVNITERVLMPGLDGLSRWLARYYRAR